MADARYFIPDHPVCTDVYSKDDLRGLLQSGKLSRSDMVLDDETGLAHLLGDLLTMPYRELRPESTRSTTGLHDDQPQTHEFRGETPLPRGETADEFDDDPDDESSSESDSEWERSSGGSPDEDLERSGGAEEESARSAGEELLYRGHPSWLAYPRSLLAFLVCGTGAWLCHRYQAGLAWTLVLGSLAVLPALFVSLDRATTTYFITTLRVEKEFGIVGRNTKEVRISDIRAIDVVQNGWNAIAGLGHVRFDSAAGSAAEVEFENVRRPHNLKQQVRELQG